MFSSIMYYTFFASALIIYGISLNRLLTLSAPIPVIVQSFLKTLISSAATTSLTYVLSMSFLVNYSLAEMYPFFAVLIYIAVSGLIELCVSIGIKNSIIEFSLPMLTTLLSINEAHSFPHALIICVSCICSFYLLFIILAALKSRFTIFAPATGLKVYILLMFSLGVITVAVFAWQNSWIVLLRGSL